MANWLDDCGRELMENQGKSRRPQGDPPEYSGFKDVKFDDSAWERVRVPHDAGIRFAFSYDLSFQDAFLPTVGSAWYRYRFSVEKPSQGALMAKLPEDEKLSIGSGGELHFVCDGAMAFPMMWVNGKFVGGWPCGHTRWRVNIAPYLKTGEDNVIAIRTYRPAAFARWYSGLGLTRRCWLEALEGDYVIPDSVAITTPEVSKDSATVKVAYRMSKSGVREKQFIVKNPRLWDVEDPALHTLEIEGRQYRYGIRKAEFFADERGFQLNGRRVQIKGCCFHQDLGSLGAVANRAAIRRRLEKAKALGMNAVRMSHYRHAEDWYELCDELGLLAMDEAFDQWKMSKSANDYSTIFDRWHERDLRAMVRANRNHPCIVLWSVGNEISESTSGEYHWPKYEKLGKELAAIVHQEDPTRPVTAAADNAKVWKSPMSQFVDVYGFNYKPMHYGDFHRQWPKVPYLGSEVMCVQASRGEYFFPVVENDSRRPNFHASSYGHCSFTIADREWKFQDENPACCGSFSWTAFDYLGGPWRSPELRAKPEYEDPVRRAQAIEEAKRYGTCRGGLHSCPTGLFDLAGFAKDEAALYRSRWCPEVATVRILPHWTWPGREGEKTPVYVYSSGDEVELFVNGVSQGRKRREAGWWRFRFMDVKYAPGELRAVAYRKGEKWGESMVRTAGEPARLEVVPERAEIVADGEEVGYVTVRVLDREGNMVPRAKMPVKIEVAGEGEFVSCENGDETDFSWFRDPKRKTFNGLLSVLVRAKKGRSGKIVVKVTPETLPSAEGNIIVKW